MAEPRSMTWRLVPWLFPIALILVGLAFVAVSLSGTDEPDDIIAPPNVRDVTLANAEPWAQRQIVPGTTTSIIGVILAQSSAESTTVYSVRAVIGRLDAPLTTTGASIDTVPDDQLRTIVTCVRWDVDVSTGAIVEHGADQLSNETGRRDLGSSAALRDACRSATFAD